MSVSVSLGQTMVEWYVYYSVVVANNQTQTLKGGICRWSSDAVSLT